MKPRIVVLLPLSLMSCLLSCLLLCLPSTVLAGPDDGALPTYDVAVSDGRVSVRAAEGSLVEVVQELGRRLDFELIAQGVEDMFITVDFEKLTQRQAIRALCQRVGYIEVIDPASDRLVRLVLTPTKTRLANRLAARQDPLPLLPEPEDDPFGSPPPADTTPPATAGDDDAGASIP